jgi:hypothetical protein
MIIVFGVSTIDQFVVFGSVEIVKESINDNPMFFPWI